MQKVDCIYFSVKVVLRTGFTKSAQSLNIWNSTLHVSDREDHSLAKRNDNLQYGSKQSNAH